MELKNKLAVNEIEIKKGSILSAFQDNKAIIFSTLFYSCGLFSGAYFYKICDSAMLDKILQVEKQNIVSMIAENICIYMSVFLLIVFLGFCLVGYPVINIFPAVIGIINGLKLSYLFINNGTKGVAYAMLMLVPFLSLFLTVISYTIEHSNSLSKNLILMLRDIDNEEICLKKYLKKMLILGSALIICAICSALIKSLLYGVVTI